MTRSPSRVASHSSIWCGRVLAGRTFRRSGHSGRSALLRVALDDSTPSATPVSVFGRPDEGNEPTGQRNEPTRRWSVAARRPEPSTSLGYGRAATAAGMRTLLAAPPVVRIWTPATRRSGTSTPRPPRR
jgi:hypothetical protein